MLSTWNERYGNVNAFAGVYQTLETPVFSNQSIWAPNLKVYSILNAVTTYQLPKAKERVLISPYANLKAQPSSRIQPSYSAIVKTANGARIILAPQDGVGTGAVGMNRVELIRQRLTHKLQRQRNIRLRLFHIIGNIWKVQELLSRYWERIINER